MKPEMFICEKCRARDGTAYDNQGGVEVRCKKCCLTVDHLSLAEP
jgi:hypothetical protein